ncbi:hypothetical protein YASMINEVIRUS_961 [Yasminevirus sp. GU-2018]|uniref:EVE domain-containing protein n=1 Tax=Yasminevirus sp. GU-2018 TaxID=2420051 RepID=A0A5K0U916_9VIRU|nr:hypothetical protein YASMINEVIRUS_961 [Yasminevirus sp. GU-2018]
MSRSRKVPKDEPVEDDDDDRVDDDADNNGTGDDENNNEDDNPDSDADSADDDEGHSDKTRSDKSHNAKKSDILYESKVDGLTVSQKCNFWLHIVSKDQWESIKANTEKGNLYLGSYSGRPIKSDDVILFYMKDLKGKPSGFVAVGQVCKDMEVNKTNKRVYADKNLNRFITELSVISILHDMCKMKDLNDAIGSANTPITSSTRFSLSLLRGEGVFVEVPYKQLGLAIVKELIAINDKYYAQQEEEQEEEQEEGDGGDESAIEDNEEEEEEEDEKTPISKIKVKGKMAKTKAVDSDENEDDDEDDESHISNKSRKSQTSEVSSKSTKSSKISKISTSSKGVKSEEDNEGDETEEGDDNSDIDEPDENAQNDEDLDPDSEEVKIVPNTPIMLIICDKLRRSLKRLKQKNSKIKSILNHCTFCSTCDVTNNNPYELNLTLARIDESSIKFIVNDYERALNAYLEGAPYPKNTNKEFIKIHHMTDSLYYSGDVLIEYSTRVEPIIEISEAKPKVVSKTKAPPKVPSKTTTKVATTKTPVKNPTKPNVKVTTTKKTPVKKTPAKTK